MNINKTIIFILIVFSGCLIMLTPLLAQEDVSKQEMKQEEADKDVQQEEMDKEAAQEDTPEAEAPKKEKIEAGKIVVTGTKTEEDIEKSVLKTMVITKKEIENLGASTVMEVFESLPGMIIYVHGHSLVELQGLSGKYVKVLINGIPVTGKSHGGTPLETLPVSEIERIEIVKGATSSLYGSDALGGVINIITKKSTEEKVLLGITMDQRYYDTEELYGEATVYHKNQSADIRITAGYANDNGNKIRTKGFMGERYLYQIPYKDFQNIRGDIAFYMLKNTKIGLGGGYSVDDKISSINSSLGAFSIDKKYDGAVDVKHNLSDYLSLDLYASYRRFEHDYQQYNTDFNSYLPKTKSIYDDIEGEVKAIYDVCLSHSLLLGANILQERLDDDDIGGKKDRTGYAVFAQDKFNLNGKDKLYVVPGLRYTYHETFGNDFSPKVSIRYNLFKTLTLRASYGQGYKTPTFKNNYYTTIHPGSDKFLITGNKDLDPEKSHSANFSVDYMPIKAFNIDGTFFYNKIYNLIGGEFIDRTGSYQGFQYSRVYQYVNKDEAYTTGAEFKVKGEVLKSLQYGIGYTYLIAKGKTKGENYEYLQGKSPHSIKANLTYTAPVISTMLHINTIWNDKQLIGDDEYSPEYLMVNLSLRQPLFTHYEIYGGVKNLLDNDEDYFNLYEGRIFYIGGKVKFDDIAKLF